MQNVGAGWLMTRMTTNPLMIGLVQAAGALPVFLVILPAGALADMVDRRRFLLLTQGWMVLASGTLGIMTLTSCVGPWVLLLFTFLLGLGAVMNDPAWQAITPELVPARQHASAVALNSAGFNVARAVGPALGGVLVAAVGCGSTFLLNAFSFLGVILFLYRWKRPMEAPRQTQRMWSAVGDGFSYVRQERTGKVCAVTHRNIQRCGGGHAGAAADHRPSLWSARIWCAPRLLWTGGTVRSISAARASGKVVG
jgi:MFS family permease